MAMAYQMFLIDADDHLHRLPISKFEDMLAQPSAHPVPQFAGQRIRAANVLVEVVNRVPTSVRRITYQVMTFDEDGWFNVPRFRHQQFGEFQESLARRNLSVTRLPIGGKNVVNAASRFAARGGTWVPSADLAEAIQSAALGRLKTRRLRV